MPHDLTTLTDAELDEQRRAVADETERRQRLAMIPAEVARLAQQYADDGGEHADLEAAVAAAAPEPTPEPTPAPEPTPKPTPAPEPAP